MVPKEQKLTSIPKEGFKSMLNHMVPKGLFAFYNLYISFKSMLNHMIPKGQIDFTWCVKIRIYRTDLF